MSDQDIQERVGDSLRTFIANVVLYNVAVARKAGLGPSDGQFLTLLDNHGALTAGQLADLSGLASGTVTGVVDRLERGGYVRRERDPNDRRKVIVKIIAEAAVPLYEHYRAYGARVADVLRGLDRTELHTIAGFFDSLNETTSTPRQHGRGRSGGAARDL